MKFTGLCDRACTQCTHLAVLPHFELGLSEALSDKVLGLVAGDGELRRGRAMEHRTIMLCERTIELHYNSCSYSAAL